MEQLYVEKQRELCRLCLRIADSGKDLISIFDRVPNPADPKNKVSFAYFLKEISTVKVTLHDRLPTKICNICVLQLQSSFVFKTQIEKSNDVLEKAFKSKSNETSKHEKQLTSKHSGPLSRTREPVIPCDVSEDSETDHEEVIREEPPTTRQSASCPKKVERNEKKIFTSQVDKCNTQQTDESSSVNVQNPKDAKVILEKLDSLKNISPCKTCGRFFCTEISYLRHDFTCVNSCKTCKIDFKNNELNFKAHFTNRHKLNLMDNVTVNGTDNEPYGGDHQHNRTYTKDEFEKKFMVSRSQGTLQCKICKVSFEIKKLPIHLNTRHLVNRPFKCSFCDDKFFVGNHRTTHMTKKHPQDYKCVRCDSQFIQHAFLEKHSLSLHNISTSVPKSPLEVDDPKPETFLYVEKKQPIEMNSSNTEFQFRIRTPKATKSTQPKQQDVLNTEINGNTRKNCNNGINNINTINSLESNKLEENSPPRKLTVQEPMNTEITKHEDEHVDVNFAERELEAFALLDEVANDANENGDREHELEEIEEEIEQQEEKEHPCEFCDKIFTSALSLRGHTNWHKRDSRQSNQGLKISKSVTKPKEMEYECDICNETSIGALIANLHMKRCHKQEFRCGQCDNQSTTYLRLKLHIIKNHPRKIKLNMSKRHKCPHCFRNFAVADCLNDHITNKHENSSSEDSINCVGCEIRFKSEENFAYHLQTYHHGILQELFDKETERDLAGAEEVYDEEQDSEFDQDEQEMSSTVRKRGRKNSSISSSSSMTSATEVLHKDDFTPPPIKKEKIDLELIETSAAADENGVSYLNFMRNIDDHFECVICKAKKPFRKLMLQHLKQHDEVPKFKCETCSQEFLFRPLYNNHLLICQQNQSNSSANRCEVCNKDFKLSIMLKQHNAKVHGDNNRTQKEKDLS